MTAVVELSRVTKTYPGGVTAVRDVSLSIEYGELVAIVGPSGSGKSTMLHLIGTLDRPSSGTIRIDGYDVATLRDRQLSALRAYRIGFVFQQFHLLERRSALANVSVPLVLAGVPLVRRRAIARELLESVGLGDRLSSQPHQLSGGEQQRVALARALSLNPALILADEPTGALDKASSTMIMDQLLDHARSRNTAVIVVTHDPEVAARADRTVTMSEGRILPAEEE